MTKLIFLGCLSSSKYLETCENAKKVINMLDSEYKALDDAPCCGSLNYHLSSNEEIEGHVQYVYNWLKSNNVKEIITICAGCYNYLTTYYKEFIPDFNLKVKHIVQFINKPQNLEKLNLKYEGKKLTIAYHDPCHLKNSKPKILEEPRNIINSIQGDIELKEMDSKRELSVCCGSGGGVYSSFKENADYNSKLIFEQVRKARAKLLLTPCPFCYTALKRIKEENKRIKIPVMKFEDFINCLIEGVEPL